MRQIRVVEKKFQELIERKQNGRVSVNVEDIEVLMRDAESWQRQVGDRINDALQFASERDAALEENKKLRSALEEVRKSTYLRHANSVAAIALGFED